MPLFTRSLVLAALVLASASVGAQPALDRLVPPSPVPNGFIVDRGPVLDDAARGRLNARITAVQQRTGGDIGVVILRDLRDRAPSDVGVAVYRAWKIGRIDSIGAVRRSLGALLLVVPKELAPTNRGECWITTGRGAEATLIDARAGTLCRDSIIPHLKEKAYEPAIAAGIDGIAAAFDDATAGLAPPAVVASSPSGGTHSLGFGLAGFATIAAGGAAGVVGLRRHRRRKPRICPRCHSRMARLSETADNTVLSRGQSLEEQFGSVDYDVWACATCDERTIIPYKQSSPYEECPQCGYETVERRTRTVRPAKMMSTGLAQTTLDCKSCEYHQETTQVVPMLPPPPPPSSPSSDSSWSSSGSSSGSSSDSGGSSFGGDGGTSGGGGGSSY